MAMPPPAACPTAGILVSGEMLTLKCGVSCPPGPWFCCSHLSEAAGSSRLAQVCLPNRLKGSGHVDPGQGCLGQPRVQPGGNAGDTEAQAWLAGVTTARADPQQDFTSRSARVVRKSEPAGR